MSRKLKRVAGVTLLVAAMALIWRSMAEFIAVDACLDRGGSYNYATGVCDFTESHPFAPQPRTASLWLALAFGAGELVLLFWPRSRMA